MGIIELYEYKKYSLEELERRGISKRNLIFYLNNMSDYFKDKYTEFNIEEPLPKIIKEHDIEYFLPGGWIGTYIIDGKDSPLIEVLPNKITTNEFYQIKKEIVGWAKTPMTPFFKVFSNFVLQRFLTNMHCI